ncbi:MULTISPECIES: hypothetical protein [Streptococcus]|uniref:hypothetical protein n=1 Tax=Streptococcus TaxID=1301 RepID=UPI0002E50D35|nr:MULTISPECIES: hypothetical protein [Streptococcus]HEP2595603.1 hypothetical protein [Streptococcus pyogenes]EPX11856.1 hypothetical protein SAG0176_00665 [Streptococcus agalactiae LDS 623]MBY4835302.1 hypothetical protein [Streptococcus agalactiae]MBY5045938.1 hypothetical protein [Streptococcus agalactiae]MBY5053109.1 hypothetical protein [Streptococcus agalactiae]
MIMIFNAIRHYLFLVILISAWVLPLFEVNIYDNFGNRKRTRYLGLAVMMLVKIFRPNSQVRWLLSGRSKTDDDNKEKE